MGQNDSTCSGSAGNGEYDNGVYNYDTSTGNLSFKTGMGTYSYDTNRKHRVTSTTNGNAYQHDSNGNMIVRAPAGGTSYTYTYRC